MAILDTRPSSLLPFRETVRHVDRLALRFGHIATSHELDFKGLCR